jgi:hypothetical protein
VKFDLYTLRYNKSYWVQVDGMEKEWEEGRIEAEKAKDSYNIETKNISALTLLSLQFGGVASNPSISIVIDKLKLSFSVSDPNSQPFWDVHLRKENGTWKIVKSIEQQGLHKVHGLQGPIDDAFLDRFIFVRPTGKSSNEAVSKWVDAEMDRAIVQWRKVFRGEAIVKDDKALAEEDIKNSNLVVWGDPQSNSVYAKVNDKLPIKPKADAPNIVPLLIYPNPLNPKKYIVTNSGFTFREYDALNNARQVPKLPDWALIDITTKPNSRYPGKVVEAGFFDEEWKVK